MYWPVRDFLQSFLVSNKQFCSLAIWSRCRASRSFCPLFERCQLIASKQRFQVQEQSSDCPQSVIVAALPQKWCLLQWLLKAKKWDSCRHRSVSAPVHPYHFSSRLWFHADFRGKTRFQILFDLLAQPRSPTGISPTIHCAYQTWRALVGIRCCRQSDLFVSLKQAVKLDLRRHASLARYYLPNSCQAPRQ